MPETVAQLVEVLTDLDEKVSRLSERYESTRLLNRRTRGLGVAALVLAALASVGVGVGGFAVVSTNHNATTACHNANEAREANLVLWRYVIAISAARSTEPRTAVQEKAAADFTEWIAELYAPRDCTDLSRKYQIPEPPKVVRQ